MTSRDAAIAQNLRALRGERSQRELAAAMSERGWKWTQPTLTAIENGERPLKLAEALDLVEILGLRSVTELTADPGRAEAVEALNDAVFSGDALFKAARDLQDAQYRLASLASYLEEETSETLPFNDDAIAHVLNMDLHEIVRSAYPRRFSVSEGEQVNRWIQALWDGPYGKRLREQARDGVDQAAPER